MPHQHNYIQNKLWSETERFQIRSQINSLICKGAIRRCKSTPGQIISSIFLVPKSDGSSRLILNLKKLNEFIETEHFKLENIKVATQLISEDCFMAKLDLSDAFHLVNMHNSHRKFLRFVFENQLYEYTCLPFGLCTAPYVFTKIMKPVLHYLRNAGYISAVYIDDFLLFGLFYRYCLANLRFTRFILQNLPCLNNSV